MKLILFRYTEWIQVTVEASGPNVDSQVESHTTCPVSVVDDKLMRTIDWHWVTDRGATACGVNGRHSRCHYSGRGMTVPNCNGGHFLDTSTLSVFTGNVTSFPCTLRFFGRHRRTARAVVQSQPPPSLP